MSEGPDGATIYSVLPMQINLIWADGGVSLRKLLGAVTGVCAINNSCSHERSALPNERRGIRPRRAKFCELGFVCMWLRVHNVFCNTSCSGCSGTAVIENTWVPLGSKLPFRGRTFVSACRWTVGVYVVQSMPIRNAQFCVLCVTSLHMF